MSGNTSGTLEVSGGELPTKSTTDGSPNVRKVVVNRRHGGFGLSEAATLAYAARKGLTVHPERDPRFEWLVTYWTVPADQRPTEPDPWDSAPLEKRAAFNAACTAGTIVDRDIPRDDADLVAVVEELGAQANGEFAALEVVELPADVDWEIEEYDGREWIAEKHRTW